MIEAERPDGIAAAAEEETAVRVLGGALGPTCTACRAAFMAWADAEGAA